MKVALVIGILIYSVCAFTQDINHDLTHLHRWYTSDCYALQANFGSIDTLKLCNIEAPCYKVDDALNSIQLEFKTDTIIATTPWKIDTTYEVDTITNRKQWTEMALIAYRQVGLWSYQKDNNILCLNFEDGKIVYHLHYVSDENIWLIRLR